MGLTKLEIAKKLAKTDKASILSVLAELEAAGEGPAAELGYAEPVSKFLLSGDAEIATAAANALGAMGSVGKSYVPVISSLLTHTNASVRVAAVQALGGLGGFAKEVSGKIASLAAEDPEVFVQARAIEVLGSIRADDQIDVLKKAMSSKSPEVMGAAAEALALLGALTEAELTKCSLGSMVAAAASMGKMAPVSCLKGVVDGIASEDPSIRASAVTVIGNLAEAACTSPTSDKLKDCLKSSNPGVKAAAAMAVAGMGKLGSGFADSLKSLLEDDSEDASSLAVVIGGGSRRPVAQMRKPKCAAIYAIGKMKDIYQLPLVDDCLNDSDWEVRLCALETAMNFGKPASSQKVALDALGGKIADLLSDEAYPVREKAALALGSLKAVDKIEYLVESFKDGSHSVRSAALSSLSMLMPAACKYSPKVFKLTNDKVAPVRAAAIRCLSLMGPTGTNYASVIAPMLNDEDPEVRVEACEALSRMGEFGAAFYDDLTEHMYEKAPQVASAARKAVAVFSGSASMAPTAAAKTYNPSVALAAERAKLGLK